MRARAGLKPACFVVDAVDAPAVPGSYLLLVTLPAPLRLLWPHHSAATLLPGRYLYAGSAQGPGGLRARLARHLRQDKRVHWHIDHLTVVGKPDGAWVFPEGDECAIVTSLAHLPVPLPGFGSTDCRLCLSHLLAWPQCESGRVPFRT